MMLEVERQVGTSIRIFRQHNLSDALFSNPMHNLNQVNVTD